MKSITVNEIAEKTRFELRRYGFRADGNPEIRRNTFWFTPEPATGQAAFSQYCVQSYFRLYGNEQLTLDSSVEFGEEGQFYMDIGVSYTHVDSGGNGYSVRYLLKSRSFDDGATLKRETI